MLCPMSLVLGLECLALKGALCQQPFSDERHALLECPALTQIREKYQQLFCVHNPMRQFLWQSDMLQLVRFMDCLDSFAPPCQNCQVEGLVRLLRGYQSGGMPGFVHSLGTDPLEGGGGLRARLQQSCLV